jgi:hypothetical protein
VRSGTYVPLAAPSALVAAALTLATAACSRPEPTPTDAARPSPPVVATDDVQAAPVSPHDSGPGAAADADSRDGRSAVAEGSQGNALADDLAARVRDAKAKWGPNTRTRVVGDDYLLVEASPKSAFFDQVAALLGRALPPLFDGRFGGHPDGAVTVLLFTSHATYTTFVRARFGPLANDTDLGMYSPRTREIAADGSGGAAFAPTLTHEAVHPILDADFHDAPLWFDEGVASLFEAPVFSKDGGIHGEPRNWRHARLLRALASPHERKEVSLDALFSLGDLDFKAWSPERGVDGDKNLLHCAMARAFVAWLDAQDKLWPFYHAWRDGFASDPSGKKAFERAMGKSVAEANAAWLSWAK